LTVFTCKLMWR